MSSSEIEQIKELIRDNHSEVMAKVNPMYDLFCSAKGFGVVSVWIAKYIVMPVIILLGALLTYKHLKQ